MLPSEVQHKGAMTIPTKVVIGPSSFPTADGDYTPAQRRAIDAQLAEAGEDIKHGRVHGPFKTHEAMMTFLNKEVVKQSHAKKVSRNKK